MAGAITAAAYSSALDAMQTVANQKVGNAVFNTAALTLASRLVSDQGYYTDKPVTKLAVTINRLVSNESPHSLVGSAQRQVLSSPDVQRRGDLLRKAVGEKQQNALLHFFNESYPSWLVETRDESFAKVVLVEGWSDSHDPTQDTKEADLWPHREASPVDRKRPDESIWHCLTKREAGTRCLNYLRFMTIPLASLHPSPSSKGSTWRQWLENQRTMMATQATEPSRVWPSWPSCGLFRGSRCPPPAPSSRHCGGWSVPSRPKTVM